MIGRDGGEGERRGIGADGLIARFSAAVRFV